MEGNFLDLVDDVARLDTLFTLKGSAREDDMEVLVLVPRRKARCKSARLWVDGQRIIGRSRSSRSRATSTSSISPSIKVGEPLADSLFVFKPDGRRSSTPARR